jgi:predicted ester cyclase
MALTVEEKRNVLVRISRDVFGGGDPDAVDELLTEDFVDHDPLPGIPPTRDGVKEAVQLFRTAFPDFGVEVLHTVVEGDFAVDHIRSWGTHQGDFMGVGPTGRGIEASAIVISHLGPDGRIVERWQRFSALQLLQQLGVVPGWEDPPPVPPIPEPDGGPATTVEENKEIVLRQLALWNDGDEAVADEIFHPEAVAPDAPQLPVGPEGCKEVVRLFRTAFPDFHMTAENVIGEGDLVCVRFRQTGTHEGELFGIAPTGRAVDFGEHAICRIAGGRIVASWFQTDMLGLMSQLGVGGEQPAPA